MVAKITVGTSLYGALAYNGMKVNEGEGKLLAGNKVFDDGSGRVDIARAEQDFKRYMPENVRTLEQALVINKRNNSGKREYDILKERLPIGDHQRIPKTTAIRYGIEKSQIQKSKILPFKS